MDPRLHERCHDQFRRRHRQAAVRLLVHGLVGWVGVAGVLLLSQIAILGWFEPVRTVRLGLWWSALALAVLAARPLLWRPLRQLRRRRHLARRLDRAAGQPDTLGAAEEALRRPDRWRTDTPVREALVGRLLTRASHLLEDLDLPRLLPVPRPVLVFGLLAAVLLAGWQLERRVPEVLDRGWRSWRSPWADAGVVTGGLQLVPGPTHVVAGADLAVAVLDLVGGPEPVLCEVRSGSGLWRPIPVREESQPGVDPVLGAPFTRWAATLTGMQEDLVYRFRSGGRLSAERTVAVWHPPLLDVLAGRIAPPAYTGLPDQDLTRLPAYIEAPVGSALHLAGRSSRSLQYAAAVTTAGDTLALAVAADSLVGTLMLAADTRFRLVLRDDRGLPGRSELIYEAAVIPDRQPVASLRRPDDDGRLPLTATLRLQATAEDDYGLSGCDLLLRRGDPDGGAWVADLPGRGEASDTEGWERVSLTDLVQRREVRISLGRLPLAVVRRETPTESSLHLDLDLQPAGLTLVPGDVLELALEARDNRQPGPPGVGRSAILRLQVPSSLELLQARDEVDRNRQGDLAEMRRRTEALGADLERLRRELLKDPVPGWDRRQELQAAVQRQQELQSELSRLADQLQRDVEGLAESRLTSPEIMEKMDRIAELLAEAQSPGMQELLEQLREQLDQMSGKDMTRAMEDLARSQAEMLRRLDTAASMLRDLAREEEMEGLTDLVAEMISKQQELAEATRQDEQAPGGEPENGQEQSDGESGEESGEDSESAETGESGEDSESAEGSEGSEDGEPGEMGQQPDPEELARRQEALAEEMEALEERLRETLEQLEQQAEQSDPTAAEQEMREALEQALEQLEQQQTQQTMQEAGENLQQDMSQQAAEQMEQALTDLAGLYHVMLRSQMAMQMAMQAEQAGQMRDLAADLLALSQRQEDLGLDLPTSLRDVRADDLARRQHVILQGTMTVRDGLEDVAGAAPREILRMLEELDGLLTRLGRTLDQLEEGRSAGARQASDGALGEMNQLVIGLLTQAQMTGQGGGGASAMPMLSQQLRQMSEEQAGLNAMAEQLRQQQGRLSQELRAGMKRLQQGQQGLAGRARQLAEEQRAEVSEEQGRLLGDLDQLARDMESVGDDLAGDLITEETLRRQDRILSRLLDMHNASRERDWARRRESRAADELFADQEGDTGPGIEELAPEARRWRPVEEAPPAYRDLVRDYFRQVQRLHESTGRSVDGQRGGRP